MPNSLWQTQSFCVRMFCCGTLHCFASIGSLDMTMIQDLILSSNLFQEKICSWIVPSSLIFGDGEWFARFWHFVVQEQWTGTGLPQKFVLKQCSAISSTLYTKISCSNYLICLSFKLWHSLSAWIHFCWLNDTKQEQSSSMNQYAFSLTIRQHFPQ